MSFKAILKRVAVARAVNAGVKCWQAKREYNALCAHYGTPSILSDPQAIARLTAERWNARRSIAAPDEKPTVIFVGTDYEQDRSGTIQALRASTNLHVFEHGPGQHGQRWPMVAGELDEVREHNAKVLRDMVDRIGKVDAVIGQMWGFTMHWRTLADLRERGIAVVNIAMDDRHAWRGRKMPDGTDGGTRGLAPYLTLGCTDAAETVSWYEAEGTRAIFFPEASDPDLFSPGDGTKRYDVSFVGASYGIRGKLVRALERAGVRVQAYGNGWPAGRIPTEDIPELFAHSRIVLGCGTIGHCEDFVALKLRDFDATMTGSMYITHENPDFAPLFESGRELGTFADVPDAIEKVRYFLAHHDEREQVGAAGRRRCVQEHTWAHRIGLLLASI